MKKYIVTFTIFLVSLLCKNNTEATSFLTLQVFDQTDTISEADSILTVIDTVGITIGFNQIIWANSDMDLEYVEGETMDVSSYLFANNVNENDKFVFTVLNSFGSQVLVDSINVSAMDTLFNETNFRTNNSFLFQIGTFDYELNMLVDIRLYNAIHHQIDSILIPIHSY